MERPAIKRLTPLNRSWRINALAMRPGLLPTTGDHRDTPLVFVPLRIRISAIPAAIGGDRLSAGAMDQHLP